MIRRAQEKFRKDGPDATFKAITIRHVDRDLFPGTLSLRAIFRWRGHRQPAINAAYS